MNEVNIVESKKVLSMIGTFIVELIGVILIIGPFVLPYLTETLGSGSFIVQAIGAIILFGGSQYFQRFRAFVAQNWGITNFLNGNIDKIQNITDDSVQFYKKKIEVRDSFEEPEEEIADPEVTA